MLRYLQNLDWRDLVASAFVLVCLFAIFDPSPREHPVANTGIEQQVANNSQNAGGPISAGWLHTYREEILAVATVFIALFTITLFFASVGQYGQLKRSVNEAVGASRRELRAYLGVQKITVEIRNPEAPASFAGDMYWDHTRLEIRNAGRTPARNVRAHINWVWMEWALTLGKIPGFNYPDYDTTGAPGIHTMTEAAIILPEGIHETFVVIGDLNPFRDAWNRSKRMYFYGRIDYDDIYGDSQWTTFCFQYDPWRDRRGGFSVFPHHNDAT